MFDSSEMGSGIFSAISIASAMGTSETEYGICYVLTFKFWASDRGLSNGHIDSSHDSEGLRKPT